MGKEQAEFIAKLRTLAQEGQQAGGDAANHEQPDRHEQSKASRTAGGFASSEGGLLTTAREKLVTKSPKQQDSLTQRSVTRQVRSKDEPNIYPSWSKDGPNNIVITHENEVIAVKEHIPPRARTHSEPKPSPFLEAMTGNVVFQSAVKQLQTDNQELAGYVERRRRQAREAKRRERQKDPEKTRQRNKEYMREWRARKKAEAQVRQAPDIKPTKGS